MTADQGLLRKKARLFQEIICVSILPLDDMISEQGEEEESADHVIKAHLILLNRIPIYVNGPMNSRSLGHWFKTG